MRFYLRALSCFRQDVRLIGLLLILVALATATGLLLAWPLAVITDSVFMGAPADRWVDRIFLYALPNNRLAQIIGVTLIGMALWVVQHSLTLVRNMINHRLRLNGTLRLRCELYAHLQGLDAAYHRSRPQGDAIYRLMMDAQGCFGILDTLVATTVSVVTLTLMVGIMAATNVTVTLFALAVAPLMVWTNLYFAKQIHDRAARGKAIECGLTTFIQRSMSAVGLIQVFGRQATESVRFNEEAGRSAEANLRLHWKEELYPWVVNLIMALGGAIIFGYGGYVAYRDTFVTPIPDGMKVGALGAMMAYLGGLWEPLRMITGFKAKIQAHVAATERVFTVLDTPASVVEAADPVRLPVRPREVVLDNVSFEYVDSVPVLRGVDAVIEPGELVAFVGPSGTGKSTLLNLLPRFYDPTAGEIRLGGIPLKDLSLADVRRHVAVVPQDSAMIAASVADNIAFGRPGATRAQIRQAAEMAGADDFISEMPGGYDTQLCEGAQNLSGGQRQRLALARALLTESPILVLDEPTSSLDNEHEKWVMRTLVNLRGRRTVILVTHRLGTLTQCDRIFVMSEGRTVQAGTHEELMEVAGPYRRMVLGDSGVKAA